MAEPVALDPATLRALARDLDERTERLARCCGGQHINHGVRIATYADLAADYRTRAFRAEHDATKEADR